QGREDEVSGNDLSAFGVKATAQDPERPGRPCSAADRRMVGPSLARSRRSEANDRAQFHERPGLQTDILLLSRAVNEREVGAQPRDRAVTEERAVSHLKGGLAQSLADRHLVVSLEASRVDPATAREDHLFHSQPRDRT